MFNCCASRPAKGASSKRAKGAGRRAADADAVVRRTGGGETGAPIPVVLLGEESCGKTSLVQRFNAQEFRLKNEVNMGASLTERVLIVRPPGESARAVQLNIWDTPGSTKVHHLAHMYYKAAEVLSPPPPTPPSPAPHAREAGWHCLMGPPRPNPVRACSWKCRRQWSSMT
eukprot:COSAG02_NODE_456_length_21968_cov_13.528145_9_plen_171_part_00